MRFSRFSLIPLACLLLAAAPEPTPSAATEPSPSAAASPAPAPSPAFRAEPRRVPAKPPWMLALAPSYGYAHFDNSPAANALTPLFNWGLEFQAGYRLLSWLTIGAATGFKYVGHRATSEFSGVSSNVRGTRIRLLEPWVGFELWGLRASVALQLMGDYIMLNRLNDDSVVRYSGVSGTRFELTHRLLSLGSGKLRIGVAMERLSFSKSFRNGAAQAVDPAGIRLTSFSVVVPYEF